MTLACEANQPNLESAWFKEDYEILPDDKFDIAVEGEKHELTIHDVAVEDEGEYTVEIGDDSSTAMLWVEGRLLTSGGQL